MTKVLFCSPYLQKAGVVTGGINVWGNNIISYYKSVNSDVDLIPVSFDRRYAVQEDTGIIKRLYYGIRDYRESIADALRTIKERNIDVMHLCTSAQLSLFKDLYLLKKAHSLGAKTVVHFHFGRIPELSIKKNWEWKMILRVCQCADSVVVMDVSSYNTLKHTGLSNVSYLPNPLSVEIMDLISQLEGKVVRRQNRVLYVGHVIPTKGVFELVEACSEIDNIELDVIGPCDDKIRSELLQIAQRKNNGQWLRLRGNISHKDVIGEMLSSGIFILPSYTEGFPNVILESMASSCSIIATNVGAIPEILGFRTQNACGIEIAPKDVESIRQHVSELVVQVDTQKTLGQKAKRRVFSTYSMLSVWKQLQEIWIKTSQL